jgi:hypothetical protein
MITEGKHLEKKGILKIKSISSKGFSEATTQEVYNIYQDRVQK